MRQAHRLVGTPLPCLVGLPFFKNLQRTNFVPKEVETLPLFGDLDVQVDTKNSSRMPDGVTPKMSPRGSWR